MDSQSELQEYLALIKKIKMLSREEEHALALKASDGDESARKKIVEPNVFYVVKKALEKYAHLHKSRVIPARIEALQAFM